ncbi:MAG: DUF4833 domain-containing protein [Bacteroidia bacterium]
MRFNLKGACLLILFFILTGFQTEPLSRDKKAFPKPEGIKHLLFYVQRTININTIVYELNLNEQDELDAETPIKAYWINYEKDKSTEPLNYLQRKLAYGLEFKLIDEEKKSYCFYFVSYKKRLLYLIRSSVTNKYEVFGYVNNKLVILHKIYIQIDGGSLLSPKIRYVEVSGRDPKKNEDVKEQIIP